MLKALLWLTYPVVDSSTLQYHIPHGDTDADRRVDQMGAVTALADERRQGGHDSHSAVPRIKVSVTFDQAH